MSSMEISNLTLGTLRKMFAEGKRFDSRALEDYRDVTIEYDVSNKAEGSARVRLGKTEVIVGVKLAIGEPFPDSPDKGNLIVSADLLPLASPRFEMGPPKFDAVELPRIVDRGIRESGMIDFSKLVVKKGEKVWSIFIDIYPINDDGNIIDAAAIASVAALRSAVLPKVDEENNVDYETHTKTKLPLSEETMPLVFSFFKLGDSLVLDPTREEEEACETRICFGVSKWNKDYMINSCQKSGKDGSTPLTSEEIEKIMEMLPKKFDELSKKLKKYL